MPIPMAQAIACVFGRTFMDQLVGGYPHGLSRGQIQQVLRWHQRWVRFRKRQGTLASLARSVGLTVHQLQRALRGNSEGLGLSLEQRSLIARWQARRRRFQARHISAQKLAESLGISRSTLFLCISKKGAYKTRPRAGSGSQLGPALRRRGVDGEMSAVRSTLLRAWRCVDPNNPAIPQRHPPRSSRKGGVS